MYRHERKSVINSQGPNAADALFTLGRTIWELWTADSPWKGAPLDRVRNATVRDIIKDCENGSVESIMHLNEKYSSSPPSSHQLSATNGSLAVMTEK